MKKPHAAFVHSQPEDSGLVPEQTALFLSTVRETALRRMFLTQRELSQMRIAISCTYLLCSSTELKSCIQFHNAEGNLSYVPTIKYLYGLGFNNGKFEAEYKLIQ